MADRRGVSGGSLVDRWSQTAAQIDEQRRALEAAGREEWNRATREGRNVAARTTSELRALGARVLPGVSAVVNGATDAATAGLGDPYVALKYSAMGAGEGRTLGERYRSIRRSQQAQDQYDRERHPKARLAGGVVGTVGSIAATGGLGAGGQGAARLAPYAARVAGNAARRVVAHVLPHVAVGGAGAATSVAGQAVADVGSGRLSSLGDYGDAAAGGAIGGLVTSYVGPRAGAIAEAATTEGVHGARTGDFSLERLENSAVLGSHAARLGDLAGRNWSENLHFKRKGDLGEAMSDMKTWVSGQRVKHRHKKVGLSKSHTFADSITDTLLEIESKFGPKARLSKNQKRAQRERPDTFVVDSWHSGDVGKATGGFSGLLFGQRLNDDP